MKVEVLSFEADAAKAGRVLFQFTPVPIRAALGHPFTTIHSYAVVMEPGNIAGNHYHRDKREVFCVLTGEVEVTFEDTESHERETFRLTNDGQALIVPFLAAHAVKNVGKETAVLMVFATHPARVPTDDLEYQVL